MPQFCVTLHMKGNGPAMVSQARLSPAEMATYDRVGLVKPAWRLPGALLKDMQASVERLLALAAEARPEFVPLVHVVRDDGVDARDVAQEFFNYATNPDILDLVEQCIGPDIIFWTSALFCKPALTSAEVPWHQDGQYWPLRPPATCTVWIALDPATRENGCMRFIPGSHKAGEYSHATSDNPEFVLNRYIDDPRFDETKAEDDELDAGELSIHDIHLLHGSNANRSGKRRAGLTLRYMPASSVYERDTAIEGGSVHVAVEFAERPIWLVRGTDVSGQNDFSRGHASLGY